MTAETPKSTTFTPAAVRMTFADADIALTFADAAADAVTGRGPFTATPLPIRALARIYNSHVQVIVRTGTGIRDIKDMRGHRISTGSPGSGTENVALRLLAASGVQPDKDITRLSQSLPVTVKGMKNGAIDAMFWTAGLPTLGISDLMGAMRDKVVFLPVANLLPVLRREAYPPLTGFLGRADRASLARTGRLANGTSWPVPVTLQVPVALLDQID